MARKRTTDKFDILVTQKPYYRNMKGRVTSPRWGGVRARIESGDLIDLKHEEFDYIAESEESEEDQSA